MKDWEIIGGEGVSPGGKSSGADFESKLGASKKSGHGNISNGKADDIMRK